MDDFRLRVFITAAKTLNFTKCAEQLYISQPAVSKHIGELESRYKVQLFERSGSRLALTEAGRVMLEHAERIADGYRRLQYEMDLFTDRLGGELKVGASTTIAQYVLPQVLARFTARFPEVKVSLASGNSDAMAIVSVASIVDELRSGELRIIDIEGCTIRREFSFCWPEGRSDALAARFVEFARHTA